MKQKLYSKFSLFSEIIKNYYMVFLLFFFIQILSGIFPVILNLYIAKIIEEFISYISNDINFSISLIVAFVVILAFNEILSEIYTFLLKYINETLKNKVEKIFMKKISFFPNDILHEHHEYSSLIHLCKKMINDLPMSISHVSYFTRGIFTFIPAIILIGKIKIWLPFVIVFSVIPIGLARVYFGRRSWDIHRFYSQISVKQEIYSDLLTNKIYSKDIKLLNMQEKILKKWEDCFKEIFLQINKITIKSILVISFLSIIASFILCLSFIELKNQVIEGNISIGNISFIFATILTLRSSVYQFMFSLTGISELNISIAPLVKLLNIEEPKITQYNNNTNSNTQKLITITNLNFKYPGNNNLIIKSLNLVIHKGQKIAIVGENGSGKSTFVKLISRLYEPLEGQIEWKGQNITNINFENYRAKLSVLFQDFSKFPLLLQENLNPRNLNITEEELKEILTTLDLDFINNKLDKALSKEIEGGINLSGGQWQKLGIARLLVDCIHNQKTELIIMDEPSSSLDPNAEDKLFTIITKLLKDKTSIIVGHRLSLTKFMDRILVFDKGVIIEDGSHKDLLNLGGKYEELYKKQSKYFI